MNWLRAIQTRFRSLFGKRKLDADMDAEMRSHIEMRTQANIEAGMNPEEARFAALRQFGWTEAIKETCREQRGVTWLENLAQDIRYGARQLRKSPGFTVVAVLTLALGIGANTAIFSAVNALWLRALPFPDSDRLLLLSGKKPQEGRDNIPFSWPNFADLRSQARGFESLGAWALGRANLTGGTGRPEQVQQAIVDSEFFTTMGTPPLLRAE